MNLNEIKIEYVFFSDALFAFSITFMAMSIQADKAFKAVTPLYTRNRVSIDVIAFLPEIL